MKNILKLSVLDNLLEKKMWSWLASKMVSKKQRALASFPRSGNTWIRRLIEEATGRKTGSIYKDRVMPRDRNGVVVKTHKMDSFRYFSAIHVIRNPYDAFESYYRWRKNINGEDITWKKHIKYSTKYWKKHTTHWQNVDYPTYLVKFEDLKKDTEKEIKKIINWIDIKFDNVNVKKAVEESKIEKVRREEKIGGKFYEKGETGYGKSKFTEKEKDHVKKELYSIMKRYSYCHD